MRANEVVYHTYTYLQFIYIFTHVNKYTMKCMNLRANLTLKNVN